MHIAHKGEIVAEFFTRKNSPKSRTFYARVGKRVLDVEVNWALSFVSLYTEVKRKFSRRRLFK